MAKNKKGPVFRVTGLRAEQSDEDLNRALRAAITENLLDDEGHLRFTTAIVPSCNDNLLRVALVEFQDGVPKFLDELVAHPLKDSQIVMGGVDITFDQHFFGFTQLYTPTADGNITADIIAITGLDGHAYGSWRGKGNLGRMWLRDFLSKDMPHCRTMIYGYNSKLLSHGISKIMDYGRELIGKLRKIRSSDEARQRPLFFIAHSFGGLILAHCLIKAVQTNEDDHPTISTLYKATYGMLLFGIPHKGLIVDDMQKMLTYEDNHPRSPLLQQISKDSDILASQLLDFKNLIRDRKVVSFYETSQTKQLDFNTETKSWERTGGFVTAVDTDSALLQLPDSSEEKLPVHADHSMIIKFDSNTNETYTIALERLRQFEKDASTVIASRFLPLPKGSRPTIMVPFPRDPEFVGRKDIIANMFEFYEATKDYQCRVALIGLGGVGKSQIAIEYAYLFGKSSTQAWVFWVHAANTSRFEEAYRAIAGKVKIPGYDDPGIDILKSVHNWLSEDRNGPWLMVLDNADDDGPFFDPDRPLESFLPQTKNGKILVTSRNRTAATNLVGVNGHIIQVEPMREDDALTLLKTRISVDESNHEDAKALVDTLEYIPLTITHAAAYIKASALVTMAGYMRRFEESEAHLVNILGKNKYKDLRRDNSIRHAVIVTWQISFAQIEETVPPAACLLALMSMFDHQDIPISLLRDTCGDTFDLDDLLTVLMDFSLVRIEIEKGSVGMHRLVQLSIKECLQANRHITGPSAARAVPSLTSTGKSYDILAQYALEIMSATYPCANLENRAMCSKYLPHAYAVLRNCENGSIEDWEQRALLLFKVGDYLFLEGRLKEAETCIEKSSIMYKAGFGPGHCNTMLAIELRGHLCLELNRWEEAEELLVETIRVGERALGKLDVITLSAKSHLSKLRYIQGRFDEAEDLAVQSFEASKKVIGKDHSSTLLNASYLALLYMTNGRLKDAEHLMLQPMAKYKNTCENGSFATHWAILMTGAIYREQGRFEEAEKLTLQAIHRLESATGEDSLNTLLAMESLVTIYIGQRRWEEAERLELRVLTGRKRRLGEEHLDTMTSMEKLIIIYMGQGQFDMGKELSIKLLQLSKEILGEEHPNVLACMNNLAIVYYTLGRNEEVEQLWIQSLEVGRRVLGADHLYTMQYMHNVSLIWKKLGRTGEAVALMRDCVERRQRVLCKDHPDTLRSVILLAMWEKEEASKLDQRVPA